jgi:hypothetical protein
MTHPSHSRKLDYRDKTLNTRLSLPCSYLHDLLIDWLIQLISLLGSTANL